MNSSKKTRVLVGTENPLKVKAVVEVFSIFFSNLWVERVNIDSGVSRQPTSLKETITGATNRARGALKEFWAERGEDRMFGVGIEAGLVPTPASLTGYLSFQYTAIVDETGTTTLGSSPAFEYPPQVLGGILTGEYGEVSEVMSKISGNPEIKKTTGAVGFLTGGRLDRLELTKIGVLMALVPWLNGNLYKLTK
ncbi:MAG: inosine/xanthosine triphosphatase [Promethearchaeota archaeon]